MTQRKPQRSKRCVFSPCFSFLKRATTQPELTVSEEPSKTASGHGEWCLFMTHFYLLSGGREKCEWRRETAHRWQGWNCVRNTRQLPCGCQENKVVVKPVRDGSFSSWYWLLSAGYGRHMGTFTRQLLKYRGRRVDGSCAQWRHSNLVEKSNDWKWSGCFDSNLAGW